MVLIPLSFAPLSLTVGRTLEQKRDPVCSAYYMLQALFLVFASRELLNGHMIEWVTGILDQPIIIIETTRRYLFLNVLGSCVLSLVCFDSTLKNASRTQKDSLKFVFISFLGFIVYFCYLSFNILLSSYVSQSMLQSGGAVIFIGLTFLLYAFVKYPFWEVKINVSRRIVFGSLSVTAALIYLIITGSILDLIRLAQPKDYHTLLPAAAFVLVAIFLAIYLSPNFRNTIKSFITRHFFRNKYDYRDLWMKFSEKSSGSLNIRDVLPRVAEFIADAIFTRQVAIWLRSATSETYSLAYCHNQISNSTLDLPPLRLFNNLTLDNSKVIYAVPEPNNLATEQQFPVADAGVLRELGIQRLVLVGKGNDVLALLGIGSEFGAKTKSTEDDQFLTSVSNQLEHLILTHKLSEELLLAREWDSFNRFASFILHDLKNLATLQSMTLENAKHLRHNADFLTDAFATFTQSTDKMISLIASLSVQRGQYSFKQQPINILEVIANTIADLKIGQRNGVKVVTAFPPKEKPPIISGDPELLQKAFTNLLLNAIQSLPKGEGAVEVTVSEPTSGKITAQIRDTGCGIPPEQLDRLFRPFQTTKERGMGIGLCHTRSIIEVHGGHIRIESQVNAGTKVELDFPTL
jgi:putative PEP-CTERM system histidine kinase